jgi:hypothetical protein
MTDGCAACNVKTHILIDGRCLYCQEMGVGHFAKPVETQVARDAGVNSKRRPLLTCQLQDKTWKDSKCPFLRAVAKLAGGCRNQSGSSDK